MNKEQTANAIAVMQAFVDGKPCRWRLRNGGTFWLTLTNNTSEWNWVNIEYQVVPEIVKYRRYLYQISPGLHSVHVCTLLPGISCTDKAHQKLEGFVRWIDKEWIEETV